MIDAKKIANALFLHKSLGPKQNFCIVENLSWGLFDWGEADYVVISKSFFLTEIEIKVSIQDLIADFSKKKWTSKFIEKHKKDIKRFFYCVPFELKDEALVKIGENNPNAGLISIEVNKRGRYIVRIEKQCLERKANKLTQEKILKIMRLAMFRYWKNRIGAEK